MSRAEQLKAFIETFHGRAVSFGVDDCAPFAALWIDHATGCKVRLPAYDSRDGGQELIRQAGGLVEVCEPCLAAACIRERWGSAQLGDVGVLRTAGFGDVGGIFGVGGYFFWRHAEGVAVLRPRERYILKVWALPEE